ncbi:hypothetical protein BKA70DRAFT_1514958 [Coprinopsis sp. MPI-PUGE-AT-0042]|nr:hypothetical protein BKA70DRAFT_1514958 [Coprinopsis sp. MPI-PUGE-AT-0042]
MAPVDSSTFATVVIHDMQASGSFHSLVLKPSASFPAAPYRVEDKGKPLPPSWDAKDISSAEGHLELRLLERLAEGRIGTVYSAAVVAATRGGIDITSTLPPKLCLKFAKKQFCRSLARDAWFYEQLQDLQGAAIAHSYGFYTSTLKEQESKHLGAFESIFLLGRIIAEWSPSLDWLPDDEKHDPPRYIDISGFKSRSSWNEWNWDRENPVIAVHVMELLGIPCAKIWEQGEKRPDLHQEISHVADDLSKAGAWHSDITAFNILQSEDGGNGDVQVTVSRLCPNHRVIHKWRVVDFDRSTMVFRPNTTGLSCLCDNRGMVGRFTVFWGRDSE